jgi:trans-L-3-hydroxyproline dehydratase
MSSVISDSSAASRPYWIETEDWHTAGEPFRIVEVLPAGHLPDAASVAECRTKVLETPSHPLDVLRRTLCHEPRGHAEMYGGFIVPPNDSGAHFGVLFWHRDSFSTACGHGTMALGFWAVSKGLVEVPDGEGKVDVVVDTPSGRVTARVAVKDGKPIYADFVNVSSYAVSEQVEMKVDGLEEKFSYSMAYGGAHLVAVKAEQFNLRVEPANVSRFIEISRKIKAGMSHGSQPSRHGVSYIAGIIFYEAEKNEPGDAADIIRERNITIVADGQVDRSPCGSGTCARIAMLLGQGRMGAGRGKLLNRSVIGSLFEGDILSEERHLDSFPSCIPRVRGSANLVGRMRFYIDPSDPVYPGFLLR